MTDNEHGFFWFMLSLGAMLGILAVVFLQMVTGFYDAREIDLGDMCNMNEDGSAVCYDPEVDSGWYFDEGTFTQ